MKKILIIPFLILLLCSSCRKEVPLTYEEVTPAMARDSLYDLMNEVYYWYNLMPSVTKEDFDDPYQLMDTLRYKPLDRWSFVADYDEFNAEMLGEFVGHGFRIGVDDAGNARIAMIYAESPLHKDYGVNRGWIVKEINDKEIAPVLISGDAAAYTDIIGPSTAGISNKFLFQNPDNGEYVTINSQKSKFTINTVLLSDTLNLSSGKTGHLVFESFITPSVQELVTAFAFFKVNDVKDLILDLRYNPGGYLDIAQILASFIAGDAMAGTTFAKLQYNDKYQSKNTTFSYIPTPSPLDLTRLVVITTRSTASASEAVMNGLTGSNINVIGIGDLTNGKPTGMDGRSVGKKYWFLPVTFKMVNAKNQGDYFEGIAPAKFVLDDITRDFGDRQELCLKEAIYYLENGSLSTKGSSDFIRYPRIPEKPSWIENGLLLNTR